MPVKLNIVAKMTRPQTRTSAFRDTFSGGQICPEITPFEASLSPPTSHLFFVKVTRNTPTILRCNGRVKHGYIKLYKTSLFLMNNLQKK